MLRSLLLGRAMFLSDYSKAGCISRSAAPVPVPEPPISADAHRPAGRCGGILARVRPRLRVIDGGRQAADDGPRR